MDNEQNTEQLTDDQEQAGKGAPIDTPEDDKKVDSDKIVEKLKKRIGKEQASKHDLENSLRTLRQRSNGSNPVSRLKSFLMKTRPRKHPMKKMLRLPNWKPNWLATKQSNKLLKSSRRVV